MSQRSDIYKQLREAIKSLGHLKGHTSTNDVMAGLDQFWGQLLRVRQAMVKTLKIRGDITDASEIDPRDFLNLYLQIHNPKKESRLCEQCCGSVEFGISECPYCGEYVNGPNSQQFMSQVVIDFDLQSKAPNWEVDLSAEEILEKGKPKSEIEDAPILRPITKRDDIIGPKGRPQKATTTHKSKLSRPTRNLIRWVKKRELAQAIPYTTDQLKRLSKSELWCLASVFQNKTDLEHKTLLFLPTNELIAFILSHQGDKPIDVGQPPVGDIPNLEEILSDDSEDDNAEA